MSRSNVVQADFRSGGEPEVTPQAQEPQRRRRDPVILGGLALVVLLLGLLVWSAFSQIDGGVMGGGAVRVEENRKTIKHPEGGVVRAIHVRNGDQVKMGQVVLELDSVRPRAQVDVLQSQYDSLLAERARLQAELRGAGALQFPPELMARAADPRVSALLSDQRALFEANLYEYQNETTILSQQIDQLQTRMQGQQIEAESLSQQRALITDELSGVQTLYDRGFAPKSRLLSLQRQSADLTGRRGAKLTEVTETRQAMGEARSKLIKLTSARRVDAARALRTAQTQMEEVAPQLRSARDQLDRTQIRAPAAGYVLNLTQFTRDGVAGANEPLMDIVPADSPLVVDVQIRPEDVDAITAGMPARVRLTGYTSQQLEDLMGEVVKVSADRVTGANDQPDFYQADVRISPDQLRRLPRNVRLQPGMPATVFVVTGKRSILQYMLDPITKSLNNAVREA